MRDNGLVRVFRLGALDADQRIARAFAATPSAATDRYIASSVTITFVDRLIRRGWSLWSSSAAGELFTAAAASVSQADWPRRYQTIARVVLIAAGVHVALTVIEGPRPGWFWMIVPGLSIAFGLLLLAASRAAFARSGLPDTSRSTY